MYIAIYTDKQTCRSYVINISSDEELPTLMAEIKDFIDNSEDVIFNRVDCPGILWTNDSNSHTIEIHGIDGILENEY